MIYFAKQSNFPHGVVMIGNTIRSVGVSRGGGDVERVSWESLSLSDIAEGCSVPVPSIAYDTKAMSEVGELFQYLTANDPSFMSRRSAAEALAERGDEGIKALAVGLEWNDENPRVSAKMDAPAVNDAIVASRNGVSHACRKVLEDHAATNPTCANILLAHDARRVQCAGLGA